MALIDVTAAKSTSSVKTEIIERQAGRALATIGTILRQMPHGIGRGALLASDTLVLWRSQSNQRRELAELDNYLLFDLGLSREDVKRETSKFFWQK